MKGARLPLALLLGSTAFRSDAPPHFCSFQRQRCRRLLPGNAVLELSWRPSQDFRWRRNRCPRCRRLRKREYSLHREDGHDQWSRRCGLYRSVRSQLQLLRHCHSAQHVDHCPGRPQFRHINLDSATLRVEHVVINGGPTMQYGVDCAGSGNCMLKRCPGPRRAPTT
jgi:hypothetical protein